MPLYLNGELVLDKPHAVTSVETDGAVYLDAVLQGEQVTNGTPASATGWTLGADWAYGSSLFTKAVGSGTTTVSQATTVGVANDTVKITYKISAGMTGTSVTMSFGGVTGTARTAAGTYTEYITATSTAALTFTPTADFVGSISLISVKRVAVTATDRVTMWSGDRIASGVEAAGDTGVYIRSEDGTMSFIGDQVGFGTPQPSTLVEIQGGLTTTGAILTLGSKETSTVANDVLGRVNFYAPLDASGTDANLVAGSIVAIAEGTFSSSNNATSLLLQTGASETATTKVVVTSGGLVLVNATVSYADNGELLEVNKSADDGGLALFCWSTTDAERSLIEFHKSSSATIGTKAIVAANEAIGGIIWRAAEDSSDWRSAASIEAYIDATPGATTDMPGRLVFSTTPDASVTPTEALRIDSAQRLFINDSANTKALGPSLTINQGAFDDHILDFKSSDVAHGRTTLCETDTFARFQKGSATGGGLLMQAFSDTDATTGNGTVTIGAATACAAYDTTKTTSAEGAILLQGSITDGGTSITTPGADENIVVIRAHATARFIFDAEGTMHSVGGVVNDTFGASGAKIASGALLLGNATEGGTGTMNIRSVRILTGAMSGATVNMAFQVPSGALLLGAQFNVNTAIEGATSWSAAFNTGSTTSLGTGLALTLNTKVNKLVVPELASAATDVTLTAAGSNFTAGVIEGVVFYIDTTSMANA